MGHFINLEVLEWFWDKVMEKEIRRTKEGTLPSPFETPVKENSSEEGELLVYQELKTARSNSNGDVFTCQGPKTPETMSSNKKEYLLAPKKRKGITGVFFEFAE